MSLSDRLRSLLYENPDKTQAGLARATGAKPASVSDWVTGKTKSINSVYLSSAARFFGVNSDWLATGKGPKTGFAMANVLFSLANSDPNQPPAHTERARPAINSVAIDLDNNPDYPSVRRVKIKAQAGVSGYAVEYHGEDGPPIVFRAEWYKAKGYRPEKMIAVRVCGESMIPSLYEDDLIVINTEQAQPKQGLPFLVSYEGEVVVKRLVRDDGLWWLTSDNPDQRRYPRTKCNGETQIIGEVVYRQTERI